MTSVNKGVKRNQYFPPSCPLPLSSPNSSPFCSFAACLYLHAPVLSFLSFFPFCWRRWSFLVDWLIFLTKQIFGLQVLRTTTWRVCEWSRCAVQKYELLLHGLALLLPIDSVCGLRLGLTSLQTEKVERKGRERGMDRCSVGGRREGEEACCFKSSGDNREDEKSIEGSIKEMSF